MYTWILLQLSNLDIFNYTCIYTWEYLQLYEKLYLGILTIIRVGMLVIR